MFLHVVLCCKYYTIKNCLCIRERERKRERKERERRKRETASQFSLLLDFSNARNQELNSGLGLVGAKVLNHHCCLPALHQQKTRFRNLDPGISVGDTGIRTAGLLSNSSTFFPLSQNCMFIWCVVLEKGCLMETVATSHPTTNPSQPPLTTPRQCHWKSQKLCTMSAFDIVVRTVVKRRTRVCVPLSL